MFKTAQIDPPSDFLQILAGLTWPSPSPRWPPSDPAPDPLLASGTDGRRPPPTDGLSAHFAYL